MPTGPDDEPPVRDETGALDGPLVPAGFESFLSAVRGMVHGDEEPVARPAVAQPDDDVTGPVSEAPVAAPDVASYVAPEVAPSPSPPDWVSDDEPSDWLPGTWVVDTPVAPRRRAEGTEKALARHEKKLRDAERRNARAGRKGRRKSVGKGPAATGAAEVERPVSRVPVQTQPSTDDRTPVGEPASEPAVDARTDRRQRRREAARAQAVSHEPDTELVASGPVPVDIQSRGSRRSDRRARRRETARSGVGGGPGESGETATVSGAMSDTARMSKLDADPASPSPAAPPGPDLPTESRSARRSERRLAGRTRRAEARTAAVRQQLAAEAARATLVEQKRLAKVEKRESRLDDKVSRKAATAAKRERHAEERAAREAAETAAKAARARQRLEGKLARFEAKAAARADKDARRLARQVDRADAQAMAEAEALERRQVRRVGRIEKRRARAEAKARGEAERVGQRRVEIERRLGPVLPAGGVTPTPDSPVPDVESLAHYLGRVDSSILPWRSRRSRSRVPVRVRRAVRIGAVCVLIGGAAVLPWAAPRVPGLIADAVPGGNSHVARIKDPPVGPRTNTVAGPVGIATQTNPLDGVRLAAAGWPRRVQVPRLHVDSTVVPISGQSGSLLPPSDPQVLGWWREGKPVGAEFGTAVITGHTVHTGGGALDNLDKLAVGDTLRVQTDDGWITYVVQRARIYSTTALARDASDIFRLSGPGRLVVITCDDWNGTFYESNAVVFAAPTADDPS